MTMLTASLLCLLGEKATKDNANLSAFVKEDVEEYAYFSAVVRGKKRSSNQFEIYKKGQCVFVDKEELTPETTAAASYCVTSTDLEDEERDREQKL